jgi:hypothetical protein
MEWRNGWRTRTREDAVQVMMVPGKEMLVMFGMI